MAAQVPAHLTPSSTHTWQTQLHKHLADQLPAHLATPVPHTPGRPSSAHNWLTSSLHTWPPQFLTHLADRSLHTWAPQFRTHRADQLAALTCRKTYNVSVVSLDIAIGPVICRMKPSFTSDGTFIAFMTCQGATTERRFVSYLSAT